VIVTQEDYDGGITGIDGMRFDACTDTVVVGGGANACRKGLVLAEGTAGGIKDKSGA